MINKRPPFSYMDGGTELRKRKIDILEQIFLTFAKLDKKKIDELL